MRQATLYEGRALTTPVDRCRECNQVMPKQVGASITNSNDIYQLMRMQGYDTAEQETFMVFAMDTRNNILDKAEVSKGGVNVVHVQPSDVLRPALLKACPQIIVAHNHPSGDSTPSPDDRLLTERISSAAALMGIRLLDHVIVARGNYYSFCDAGDL